MTVQRYYLGCPIWSNRDWGGRFFTSSARPGQFLSQYSAVFNTVEGNTTFYGLPRADAVARWRLDAAPGFQFCFKFPQTITHQLRLRQADAETRALFERLQGLGDRLGPFMLQLPPGFGPNDLPALDAYLVKLPEAFRYAVEVRHPDFFAGGAAQQTLDELLQRRGCDRVILDSRALFSASPTDPDTREAQRKKPRLPAPAVATAARPLLRFIGHPEVEANRPLLEPWIRQAAQWLESGKTPYIFLHTPNNRYAPELARLFHHQLQQRVAAVGELPPWPAAAEGPIEQLGLF